jgi:uncharacterized protein (DUF885 family)
MKRLSLSIENICRDFFTASAEKFPIVSASDEFYYFPQVTSQQKDWSRWDDFSKDAVSSFAERLTGYERDLAAIQCCHEEAFQQNVEARMDFSFLKRAITTLREQLVEVRTWEKQPTFYLTIACLGLAEALESGDFSAAAARAGTLPAFIDNACKSLENMPELFRDLGLTMLNGTRQYFLSLTKRLPSLKKALQQLQVLEGFLHSAETQPDFRMPQNLVEKIFRKHLNCGLDIPSIASVLDAEIDDMQAFLEKQATAIERGASWENMIEKIPMPEVPDAGLVAMYHDQVQELKDHCMSVGFLSQRDVIGCPVRVLPVPSFLSATRTASSYSIPPDYPPTGGVFYVINADNPEEASKAYQREFRILTAHETYPGHHFLDATRLSLGRPIRRYIERPIFYEGWACFAETLMQVTGYFSTPYDQMLLARRRLWRAMRGKVDLGLQTGTLNFSKAAEYLMKTGINPADAASVVRKYPLNPGYQLCYTLGLRQFLKLFQLFGENDLNGFVRRAVSQGEIDFENLQRILALKSQAS